MLNFSNFLKKLAGSNEHSRLKLPELSEESDVTLLARKLCLPEGAVVAFLKNTYRATRPHYEEIHIGNSQYARIELHDAERGDIVLLGSKESDTLQRLAIINNVTPQRQNPKEHDVCFTLVAGKNTSITMPLSYFTESLEPESLIRASNKEGIGYIREVEISGRFRNHYTFSSISSELFHPDVLVMRDICKKVTQKRRELINSDYAKNRSLFSLALHYDYEKGTWYRTSRERDNKLSVRVEGCLLPSPDECSVSVASTASAPSKEEVTLQTACAYADLVIRVENFIELSNCLKQAGVQPQQLVQ